MFSSLDIRPIFRFCLIFLSRSNSLITCRLHQTASFFSLITYHPNRRSTLVLSSGWLPIALSVWWLLSCMIHRPTKQCYCRLGLRPLALVALPARSHLRVYKLYYYSTWTLSLSFHTIETSEPESWKSCISHSTSQSHSSLQLHRYGASQSVHHQFCPE